MGRENDISQVTSFLAFEKGKARFEAIESLRWLEGSNEKLGTDYMDSKKELLGVKYTHK